MEIEKSELIKKLELRTQEYSVLITDTKKSSCGTGLLFYTGAGDEFYVFTCAHVIDELTNPIKIYYFVQNDREMEDYRVCCVCADKTQVQYSPMDEITVENGVRRHSVDVAVLCLMKEDEIQLEATKYTITEARKGNKIFAHGYPMGCGLKNDLLYLLDAAHGTVLHNAPNSTGFTFRIEDGYMDAGNRIYEMQGFSGSPLWNGDNEEISIMGLLASGFGETMYRGKVSAVKMEPIRSIMKNHFHILLETRIAHIPEEDVAGGQAAYKQDKAIEVVVENAIYDEWLVKRTEKVRAYIDDIKFQSAIDLARQTMQEPYFERCSDSIIKQHMQHLHYCYEVCYLEDEFYALEEVMKKRKFFMEHDPLRWMTFCFGNKRYQETLDYAKELLVKGEESELVLQMANLFCTISRAYTEKAPVEETLLQFLDEKENLKSDSFTKDAEALVYQMLGFVYGECYRKYTKSVRCLNRSYRIGFDNAVLESLGCAYYFLGIEGAAREDDTVDMDKLDRASLYKARDCFLMIMDKADELYLSAMFKREGLVIFNTFYFLSDTYRILTIYPILRKHMSTLEKWELRDLERKYTRILCQGGIVDLSQYPALTGEDRVLMETLGCMNEISMKYEFIHPGILRNVPNLEKNMMNVIAFAEENMPKIAEQERMAVVVSLMNLYGRGRLVFGWNVAMQMERHLQFIRESGRVNAGIIFENFLFENSHSVEEAEERYVETWKQNPCFEFWQEILQFYKRNWMLDKADAMFEALFQEHEEYVKEEPEYAYRAYIDYIMNYRRDIKDALRFYLEHQNEMKDEEIRSFWEHELMRYTNSFNNPEDFEQERLLFLKQGLLRANEFHRDALIAYMYNLNSKKAWEHFSMDNPAFGFSYQTFTGPFLTMEGAQFLIWQRKYPPHMEPAWNGMIAKRIPSVQDGFLKEEWHAPVEETKKKLNFNVNRCVVMDAWALYLLAAESKLELLREFDSVYVTHSSIAQMLEDMWHYKNVYLESVIAYLEIVDNIKLQSPNFEYQLQIRDKVICYDEACSTVAMALEIGCPAVLGEPIICEEVINGFRDIIVRYCDFDDLWLLSL